MRKIFQLHVEGKNPDRVLEAVKHDIRKYIKRERRRDLPADADFWDFDCQFGATKEAATVVHLSALTDSINSLVAEGGKQFYVEILAKPGKRTARPAGTESDEANEVSSAEVDDSDH